MVIRTGTRITGEQVKAFWKYMSNKYNFQVIDKGDSEMMKLVAWALDMMEIQDADYFMKNYTTTVTFGEWRAVYVPFEIGKGTQAQLIAQVETCVHECQHVVQADRDPMHSIKYLTNDTHRAYYEADAYRTNMEMHWFFTMTLLSPKTLANKLKGYSVGAVDRRICEKHLIIAAKVVERGGVISGTSKVAIAWWKKRGVVLNMPKLVSLK
jgi:hypothetical protein